MKTLNASGIELDVSYLSNSDCYRLVEALAPYHEKVKITSEQENHYALAKKTVVKCYKTKPMESWKKNGWGDFILKSPTRTLTQATTKEVAEAPLTIRGIACDEHASTYLRLPPSLSFEIEGMTIWAENESDFVAVKRAFAALEFVRDLACDDPESAQDFFALHYPEDNIEL